MRRNRSETAKRRSHHALVTSRSVRCECGAMRRPHHACPECGKYNGKVIIDVVARAKREQRRLKRKDTELKASGRATEKEAEVDAK